MTTNNKELFIRYFSGQTSETENDAISSWMEESVENQKQIEDMYFIWQTSKSLHIMATVDSGKALSSLKTRINKKKEKKQFNIFLRRTSKIIAAVLVPVLLFSNYLYYKENDMDIQFIEIKTNPGVITSVILPDSTKVWINASSYLKYPSHFNNKKREVYLDGEGYFEVKKDKKTPFLVKVHDNYTVNVLGTKFNVRAYSDDNKIETTLVNGAVNLNIEKTNKRIIQYDLKPNQKAIFEDERLYLQWVDPIYEMGWKEGKMYFKNHPIEEVIKRLSRHYNVTFNIKNTKVFESLITAKFESEQLLQVLEYIKLASGIQYIVHESNIEGERLSQMKIELTK
ncbi:FecR family protein [Massilibacteroides sp.]|uniref:FecR family protein n=1 Tax=Massilibacteroides sp. TaxID=2034766 RepID=UPI00261E165D|nr:FecR family protein [Massilibacteroides sp.]MDD4514517.1 FecR family protein [Massilibacteroides sp.]